MRPKNGKGSNVASVFRTLLLCCACLLASGSGYADAPSLRYYAATAEPLDFIYRDSRNKGEVSFHLIGITYMMPGEQEYVALTLDNKIRVFQHGKLLHTLVRTDPNPVGWLREELVFTDQNGIYRLNPKSGKVFPWALSEWPVLLQTCAQGYLVVFDTGERTQVSLFDTKSRLLYSWQVPQPYNGRLDSALIRDRFFVIRFRKPEGGEFLWIADIQKKTQRQIPVRRMTTFFGWNAKSEIVVGLAQPEPMAEPIESTKIVAIDCDTLRRRTLFVGKKQLNPIGFDASQQWIVALRPYYEVGPCAMLGIDFAHKKTRLIRENVYNCILVEPTPQSVRKEENRKRTVGRQDKPPHLQSVPRTLITNGTTGYTVSSSGYK